MPYAALRVKVMPSSPDVNLEKMKEIIKEKIEGMGGKIHLFEEEPIAFGLSALIVTIAWPEEKGLEIVEDKISEIDNINSVEIVDFRRAIG